MILLGSLTTVGLLFLVATKGHGQSYYWQEAPGGNFWKTVHLDFGLGFVSYFGDLKEGGALSGLSLGFSGAATKQLSSKWGWSLTGTYSPFSGERTRRGETQRVAGTLLSAGTRINWHFIKYVNMNQRTFTRRDPITKVTAYFFLGLEAVASSSDVYTLAASQTTEQRTGGNSRKISVALPIGVGFKYRFPKRWSLGAEFGYLTFFTDELDATALDGTAQDLLSSFMLKLGYAL
ncbi:MAG: hypothetical protein AAGB22_01800 [Bacteroidota bacterium]